MTETKIDMQKFEAFKTKVATKSGDKIKREILLQVIGIVRNIGSEELTLIARYAYEVLSGEKWVEGDQKSLSKFQVFKRRLKAALEREPSLDVTKSDSRWIVKAKTK